MKYEYKNYKIDLKKIIKNYKSKLDHRINFEKEMNNIVNVLIDNNTDKVNKVLACLGEITDVNRVYIFEFKNDLKIMDNTYEWCAEGTESEIDHLTNLPSEMFPWWMNNLKNNQSIIIEDVDNIPASGENEKQILKDQDIKSVIVIPLFKDELIGFIGFDDTEKTREWNVDDISLLSSAGELIISHWEKINREKKLYSINKRLFNTVESIINALANLGSERDPYTRDHSINVAKLSKKIAKKLGYDKSEILIVERAAKLHDIGKVNIPQSILFKPGKLNKIEYEMIKKHSEFGYEIVNDIYFSQKIKDIILQHHERLDGSGYPFQLKDNKILKETLIVSVADVFDSMTSHRAYRPALSRKRAVNFLIEKSGTKFDTEVVNALVKIIKNYK